MIITCHHCLKEIDNERLDFDLDTKDNLVIERCPLCHGFLLEKTLCD